MGGVLVADYWILRRKRLDLADLYLPHGRYGGWHVPRVVATLVGCALAWGGLVVPALKPLYDYAWFVGFFAAGVVCLPPPPGRGPPPLAAATPAWGGRPPAGRFDGASTRP